MKRQEISSTIEKKKGDVACQGRGGEAAENVHGGKGGFEVKGH